MKYLRKYNENVDTFDVNFAIAKILEQFPFEKVKEMLDKEVLEWTPEDEDGSYPSSFSEENEEILRETIQSRYNFLNY